MYFRLLYLNILSFIQSIKSRKGRELIFKCPLSAGKHHTTCMFLYIASPFVLRCPEMRLMVIIICVLSTLPITHLHTHSYRTHLWCHNIPGPSHQDGAWPMQSQHRHVTEMFPQKLTGMSPSCLLDYGSGRIRTLDLYSHGPCHVDMACLCAED